MDEGWALLMAEFPAMPLWTDAYLGDTTHLTTTEHGAYLLLLIAMWRTSEKRLPSDDKLLARYARCTAGQWTRMKPILMEFFKVKSGFITQSRLTDEAVAVRQHSRKQSDKAKSRWLKSKETDDATALPEPCRSDAPLTLNPTQVVDPKVSTTKSASALDHLSRIIGPDLSVAFIAHRRALKAPMTDHAAKLMAKKLATMADPIAAVEQSITSGWKDVFPPKAEIHRLPNRRQNDGERLDDQLDALKARLAVQRLE